jgi:uncharacterized LabA/DUF88 family protein
MSTLFPRSASGNGMVFADGENLAIRYGRMLVNSGGTPPNNVQYKKDIFVWGVTLNNECLNSKVMVIRKHYYTSVPGNITPTDIEDKLKAAGIEAPRVFPRHKGRGSKRVDITLATEMLSHAARKNFDVAILVAGDEDYVPLVEAVKSEGRRVYLWFVDDGLSPALRRSADYYADIGKILTNIDQT